MLEELTLQNFTVFKDAKIEFSPGVNVFIGANATGKTHAMKAAYAVLHAARTYKERSWRNESGFGFLITLVLKVSGVLLAERARSGNSRLVSRHGETNKTNVGLKVNGDKLGLEIIGEGSKIEEAQPGCMPPPCLFIPAREVLSMSPGFLQAYKNRELAFDETYYDVIFALSAGLLRGPAGEEADALLKPLREHIKFKVTQENDSFYLESDEDGKVEAQLAAEGHRKFATLIRLIANGSLKKGGILSWDEPEANLNPRLTKVLADYLLFLAGEGIQVVLATHDFLLTNELSMQAEYKTDAAKKAGLRFFSLTRGDDHSVSVQHGDSLVDIDDNPIMDEAAALYNRERALLMRRDQQAVQREA